MHNNVVVADIRGVKGVIFDLRQNPFMSCRAIRYDPSQVVYPCNPRPKFTSQDTAVKESQDNDKDSRKAKSENDNGAKTRLVMIIFSIFGVLFALGAVTLLVWGARRRRRRQRVLRALDRIRDFFRGI